RGGLLPGRAAGLRPRRRAVPALRRCDPAPRAGRPGDLFLPEVPAVNARAVQALLLDMGGVLLEMGNPQGMPVGKLDFRGREAMAQAIRDAGGRLGVGDLEELFFAPWRREY